MVRNTEHAFCFISVSGTQNKQTCQTSQVDNTADKHRHNWVQMEVKISKCQFKQ